jgi:HSP20 family protein
MSEVAITKVSDTGKKSLPIFDEIRKRFEAVQRRAFELFERRGSEQGQDREDWLEAEREIMGFPAAELKKKDGAYELEITLPGFESKDVEVTATPREVIVRAAREDKKKTKTDGVIRTEFSSEDVYRSFEIPNAVNVDKVTANLENGILRISAPEIAKPKETKAVAA